MNAITEAPTMQALSAAELAALHTWLNGCRRVHPATPGWEFCEGFMAALVCCRRPIEATEYLPVLLGQAAAAPTLQEFLPLWQRRWAWVERALSQRVQSLYAPGAYQPELVERPGAFGQHWARGFMAAVAAWPLEWAGPRNAQAQVWRRSSLACIEALTEPDTGALTQHAFEDGEGAPCASAARLSAVGDAVWAVYSLHDTWKALGPRVTTVVHREAAPGRNHPCPCGSGKKFKKCCDRPSGEAGQSG